MAKLTFDEALEKLNDGATVSRDEIRADALRRNVWVASNGLPGCLNDSSSVCISKHDAAQSIIAYFESCNDCIVPRGMKTALSAPGTRCVFNHDGYLYRVEKLTLWDLF